MTTQYMEDGFAPHVDRGFATARTRLEPSRLVGDQGGETAQHSRALVKHILALEPERVPAVTAELFAENHPHLGCRPRLISTVRIANCKGGL